MAIICGIYGIHNLVEPEKWYVGQSCNVRKRISSHKSALNHKNSKDYSKPLYEDIRRLGIDSFEISLLEECRPEELNAKEIAWIDKLNSATNGYNISPGGNLKAPKKCTKEVFNKICSELRNSDKTMKEIAREFDISEEMIQGINTGRHWHFNSIDYPIRKQKSATDGSNTCCDCGAPISAGAKRCGSCESKRRVIPFDKMPVSREKLKGLIRNMPFTKIALLYGVTDNSVRKWCIKYGLPHKSKTIRAISEHDWNAL